MRRAGLAIPVLMAAGLIALVLIARGDERSLAFSRGVPVLETVVDLPPGLEACQGPIHVPESFDLVELFVDPRGLPLAVLEVTVRDADTGETISHGELIPDKVAPSYQRARLVAGVPAGGDIAVCVRNEEDQPVVLEGAQGNHDPDGSLTLEEKEVPADLYVGFVDEKPRSVLSQVGDMFDRAALWRPGWVGAWIYWVLFALVALAVPALLTWAVHAAQRDP